MSKTAWTTSRMSRHTRRSGKRSNKCDYDISNAERAATRPYDVGTWTGLARAVAAWSKRSGALMDFRTQRPQRGFGRSERSLAKLAEDLTRFLTKTQRSLTYDTLHLSSRQRETLAFLLVEFAEDLSHDIGIWRSLEAYNRDFFGTPLPCVLQPDEAMDADPVNPDRIQFLLWTLYAELEPGLILAD